MSRLSRVCREGQPGAKHPPCMSCQCPCHNVRAPVSFREQAEHAREAARARDAAERQDGAA